VQALICEICSPLGLGPTNPISLGQPGHIGRGRRQDRDRPVGGLPPPVTILLPHDLYVARSLPHDLYVARRGGGRIPRLVLVGFLLLFSLLLLCLLPAFSLLSPPPFTTGDVY